MGAWGCKPQDNDTAADFCTDIDKMPLPDLIRKGLASEEHEEAFVAAWLLQQIGVGYVYDIYKITDDMKLAVKRLQKILDDSDWMSDWDDGGEEVRVEIVAIQNELGRRLNS